MSHYLVRLLLIFSVFLTVRVGLSAQTPCVDSSSAFLGQHWDSLALDAVGGFALRSGGKTNTGQIAWEFIAMRNMAGGIDYHISTSSIHVIGDGTLLDAMSTQTIFSELALATVQAGIGLGYTPCDDTCRTVRVFVAACVDRTGIGSTTGFIACIPYDCCIRTYSVCCPEEVGEVITLLSMDSPGCSSSASECEPTCGSSEEESLSYFNDESREPYR